MPNFVEADAPYLGEFNPNTSGFVSIDIAIDTNGDMFLDPVGDISNVTGNQKLIQDIRLFLLSPVGVSLADPSWGNKALELLGHAISRQGEVEDTIHGALLNLQQFKENESKIRGRALEASELIASIQNITITTLDPTDNRIAVAITVTTADGSINSLHIPLISGGIE